MTQLWGKQHFHHNCTDRGWGVEPEVTCSEMLPGDSLPAHLEPQDSPTLAPCTLALSKALGSPILKRGGQWCPPAGNQHVGRCSWGPWPQPLSGSFPTLSRPDAPRPGH